MVAFITAFNCNPLSSFKILLYCNIYTLYANWHDHPDMAVWTLLAHNNQIFAHLF